MAPEPSTYQRWADGQCPCCSHPIVPDSKGAEPMTIGEGVRVCGACRWHQARGLSEAILTAIIECHDGAIDAWVKREPYMSAIVRPWSVIK